MAMLQFPIGFRLTDEELVGNVLLPKEKNEPLPFPCVVREFDQFRNKHPYQIWDMCNGSPDGKTDLYFLIKSNQSKSRTIEADGSHGKWRNQGKSDVEINNQTIGIKRRFSYKNRGLPEENGRWIMYEYSLDVENSSYVICLLRKKPEKKNESTSRKRKPQTQSEHQAQVRHSAAVQIPLPPKSQHEEDIENQGSSLVAEFVEELQNPGSTSHQQYHSDLDPVFIPSWESFAVNPAAFPEPQSPLLQNMNMF